MESAPDPQGLYGKAAAQEKAGRSLEACQSYTLFWKTYPGHELAPGALFHAAAIIAPSDPDRSMELYRSLLSQYPRSQLVPQSRQNLLDLQISRGRYAQAHELFAEMFKKQDPRLVKQGVKLARGLADSRKPDKVLALVCMIFPHGDKASQDTLLPLWKGALEGTEKIAVIEGLETKVTDKRLRDPLLDRKTALMREASAEEDSSDDQDSQEGWFPAWVGKGQGKGTVGVLLPLSGKYESVGLKALKGIELASGVFSQGASSPLTYEVRDYGDNEQSIEGIIASLDTTDRIVAIIGPIGESASGIACREAQKRGIPALVFTREDALPAGNTLCFSNFVSVDVQAEALLKAAAERGITRFGILYPTDNFGKTFTSTFVHKAKDHGVTVVRQVEYSPDLGDFKASVQKIFKAPAKPAAGKAKGADGSFQGLLIPDSAQNAGMIASYLPYLNIRGVRLFGPALWDGPDLARIGGRATEDALFVSGFYTGSQSRKIQAFIESFYSTFGYRPSLWEANAYDSAGILQGLAAQGNPTRASLQAAIGSLHGYPGLTGTTSFKPNGSVSKDIYLLTIKNGVVQEVVP